MLFAVTLCVALGFVAFQAQGQPPARGQAPGPSADPYANNPDAGKTKFPWQRRPARTAAPKTTPLPGGVNPGSIDPSTWKYGPQFRPPTGRQDLESGQGEADGGRQGDRRHACSARPIRSRTARWPMPATTSSGPRCSTTIATGRRPRACGGPARTRKPSRVCASPTPTSVRFSARPTPALS